MKRLTTDEAIKRSIEIHGEDAFDRSQLFYSGMANKIKLKCNKCNTWLEQSASSHLIDKCGCRVCAIKSHSKNLTLTTEEIVRRSIEIHGEDAFDRSMIDYKHSHEKIKLKCNKCNTWFEQFPTAHINNKKGCPECSKEKQSIKMTLTTEEIVRRSIEIHGEDAFDRSMIDYKHSHTPIELKCLKCFKSFNQLPTVHINKKSGCPFCCYRAISKKETEWLDSFNNPNIIRQCKIELEANKFAKVDGYDKNTNTIYEYYGKYWHGHPDFFVDMTAIHERIKKPIQEIYDKTLVREQKLRMLGYNLITIWK